MSGAPAVLIPRGLQQVHPQLEPAFKSIAGAIARLHSTASAAASSPGLAASVANLEEEIGQLQAEIAALGASGKEYTAGSPIPAYSVVREVSAGVVGPADSSSLATAYAMVGIATAAAAPGQVVLLARDGETVTNTSWTWTPGPVFLATAGSMTQTAPAISVLVGYAISATSILVSAAGGSGLSPIASGNILSNLTAGSATPVGNSLSAALDYALGSTQGSIVYRGPTSWSELAPGALGQVLLTGGAGANPSWGTNSGAAGSMMLLQTKSGVSGASSVQFTNLPSGYDFVVMADNFLTSVNTTLNLQFGQGAGPTWDASANYYWQNFNASTSGSPGNGTGGPATSIQLSSQTPVSGTNNGTPFNFTVSGGSEVSASHMVSGSCQWFTHNFIGVTNNAYALTGIQIYPGSGTMSGNFRLYGICRTQPNVNSVGSGLQLLGAPVTYRPASDGNIYTVTSTNPTNALDATNLTATFTAPASGQVIVHLDAVVQGPSGGSIVWNLLSGGAVVANSTNILTNVNTFARVNKDIFISGLTPGASYTYQWGAHISGSGSAVFYAGPNGGSIDMLVYAVNTAPPATISSGPYASAPATPLNGQMYKCTDAPCEMLYQGGAWQYWYGDIQMMPFVPANYSWLNQGSAALTSIGPYTFMSSPGTSGDSIHGQMQNLPAAPSDYKVWFKTSDLNRDFLAHGIFVSDGTKLVVFDITGTLPVNPSPTQTNSPTIQVQNWNSATSFNATVLQMGAPLSMDKLGLWLHDDGTNFNFYYSVDGVDWVLFFQISRTAWLTPSKRGWYINSINVSGTSMVGAGSLCLGASA